MKQPVVLDSVFKKGRNFKKAKQGSLHPSFPLHSLYGAVGNVQWSEPREFLLVSAILYNCVS